jgi:phospholipase A1/A2
MKILKTRLVFRVTLACVLFLLITAFSCNAAEIEDSLAKCAAIQDDNNARLKCFDDLANKQIPVKEKDAVIAKPAKEIIPQESSTTKPHEEITAKETPGKEKTLSVMEKHWDLNVNNRGKAYIIRPYRMNYLLPVAYNSSPNEDTALEYDSKAKSQYNEAKFQISFKAKVWEDVFQDQLQGIYDKSKVIKGIDIWVAYTQLSFWQVYNSAFSAPFRDTNYEPEMLINFRTQYKIPIDFLDGTKLQFINVGVNHQSNGRSKPLSRSWNRIVANFGLERNNFNLQLKTWYRLPENEADDDNPDLIRYMGYGELWATLYWKDMRFATMLRNNLRQENLGAIQLEWSITPSSLGKLLPDLIIPAWADKHLSDKFSLYFQYFNGYGEGLMDYNKSINRFSAGVMIAEWN